MRLLDERARSEHPDAWAALTGGGATLHRALLHVLWDQPQFGLHKERLLELLERADQPRARVGVGQTHAL